jgi:transcriptional regulator with PAS, ATPase and Fis domain
VRIAAATNIPAEELYLRKILRRDLFFRIQALSLFIPPLRERRGDIVELAEWFLARCRPHLRLAPESVRLLTDCDWPGNVRQLFSVLKRSLILPSHEGRRTGELRIDEVLLKPFHQGSSSGYPQDRRREEVHGV